MTCAARRKRLQQLLNEQNLPALLVTHRPNYYYLSGFNGSVAFLLISADRGWLIVDFRYREQAGQQAGDLTVLTHEGEPAAMIRQILQEERLSVLAFEQDHLPYGAYLRFRDNLPGVQLRPAASPVEQLRAIKDEQELMLLKQAAAIADSGFAHLLALLRPGMTEAEAALELEHYMRAHGGQGIPFTTIVASGARSALPHGVASRKKMEAGDFVVIDFGITVGDYCSDMTRTVCLGKKSAWQQRIYSIVQQAQQAVIDGLQEEIDCSAADALGRRIIAGEGFGNCFGHGMGHGIGLEAHEAPVLSPRAKGKLRRGMVFSVEPGIYLPGRGGVRIEDMVALTPEGPQLLTAAPKAFITV